MTAAEIDYAKVEARVAAFYTSEPAKITDWRSNIVPAEDILLNGDGRQTSRRFSGMVQPMTRAVGSVCESCASYVGLRGFVTGVDCVVEDEPRENTTFEIPAAPRYTVVQSSLPLEKGFLNMRFLSTGGGKMIDVYSSWPAEVANLKQRDDAKESRTATPVYGVYWSLLSSYLNRPNSEISLTKYEAYTPIGRAVTTYKEVTDIFLKWAKGKTLFFIVNNEQCLANLKRHAEAFDWTLMFESIKYNNMSHEHSTPYLTSLVFKG